MSIRSIAKIVQGIQTSDGAGVKLTRVFSHNDVRDFDPFLLLDSFGSVNPDDYMRGFPMHPHRGIETVTYLIDGAVEHRDSIGNNGVISKGDCQWMTSGSGILHEEMPKQTDRLWGAQLWVNLPAKDKMTTPAYNSIPSSIIPLIKEPGAETRVIAGSFRGKPGGFQSRFVDVTYLDVSLDPDAHWRFESVPEHTLFIYVLEGELLVDKQSVPMRTAVLFGEGDELHVQASGKDARFLLATGKKLSETIAWGGPVAMNTHAELRKAFKELDEGTFIKHAQTI